MMCRHLPRSIQRYVMVASPARRKLVVFLFCFAVVLVFELGSYAQHAPYRYSGGKIPKVQSPTGHIDGRYSVALLLAIGDHEDEKKNGVRIEDIDDTFVLDSSLFRILLTSFCRTASSEVNHRLYISHERGSRVWSMDSYRKRVQKLFAEFVGRNCRTSVGNNMISVFLTILTSTHRSIGEARNQLTAEAYQGNDYLFHVSSSTHLLTTNWDETLIRALLGHDPPNVGIVSPTEIDGGADLDGTFTHAFYHRVHVQIFGRYAPNSLTSGLADDWATHVYAPLRANRVSDVTVVVTNPQPHQAQDIQDGDMDELIEQGRLTLNKWFMLQRSSRSHGKLKQFA